MLKGALSPVRPVLPLLGSALMMVAGVALANLLVPLRADMEGWSAGTIGLIGTAYSSAFTLGCIAVPLIIRRLGHIRTFGLMLTAAALSFGLLALHVHPASWAIGRALTGFAAAATYTIIEAWLNEGTDNASRGLVFSWYMLACLIGAIVGQYGLPLGDPAGTALFIAAGACFAAAILPTALSGMKRPEAVSTIRLDFRGVLRNSPAAAVGNVVSGVLFGSWSSFGALYAADAGYGAGALATFMMCATVGGLVFQFPVGRLSDRIDRRLMMAALGTFGLVMALAAAVVLPKDAILLGALYFCLGATFHPAYALNVAHANDHAAPGGFVGIAGAMMVTYGLGTIAGPSVAGFAIDLEGYRAFFLWMAFGYAVYIAYPLWRMTRRPPPDRTAFNPAGSPRV